ncbi:MAG: 23S rRNA (adenine(2503)-C(2))-methyltransferase RlmN [Candidatus Methylacidiphilales bacterium]|nr:23S rRNA (adenine(2503)-C(2))-methyltransferase RlmN [Candidatus Methylacidiphilales bacterium]
MGLSLYGCTFPGMERLLESDGIKPVHARVLWRALYRDLAAVEDLADRKDFPAPLRSWCRARGFEERIRMASAISSIDGLTRKFLLKLEDGHAVETVLMGYPGRSTACVSTQAGCAMGCVFCATGQMGFSRHLTAAEVVFQVVHDQRVLQQSGKIGLRNVVLMGMGEPLHNYEAVMQALEIITDSRGLNLGASRITVSTVGHVPGILRLAEEGRPYHLAVSLHGATQEARAALVPVARKWPLDELMRACRTYAKLTKRRIFVEWTLIDGRNDSPEQARELASLLAGLDCHVNLIPLNPTEGYREAPAGLSAARAFQRVLADAGLPSTVRQRRGIDVAAGCGQLKAACG